MCGFLPCLATVCCLLGPSVCPVLQEAHAEETGQREIVGEGKK